MRGNRRHVFRLAVDAASGGTTAPTWIHLHADAFQRYTFGPSKSRDGESTTRLLGAQGRGHTDPRQHRDSRNAAAPGAGSSSPAGVLDAAKASDLILIPCRPAILDLEAVSTSFDLVQTTGTPVFVVLNAVSPQGREADDAAATIASLGIDVASRSYPACEPRGLRPSSLVTGLTAQEFQPKGKAAKEVSDLHAFTCAHLHVGRDRAHDRLRKRA